MPYITVKQSPMYHQLTLEEFMFGADHRPCLISMNETNTRTYQIVNMDNPRFAEMYNIPHLIRVLNAYNASTAHLRVKPRHELYHTFWIPKRSRGFREINAPCEELMTALREMKKILESDFGVLYHTSAFAYIKKRSAIDAVKRHQQNESKWFAKFDFSNFFGSTTLQFVMSMLEQIFPFSEVVRSNGGREALETFLELAFLDNVLPQGTPVSPTLTNLMMIPIDHHLYNKFRNFGGQYFVYTRYADDILVSSKYDFSFRQIEQEIRDVLRSFNAPFTIKEQKTRYGSSAGRNWNLGVMLNKDNKITIGRKRKREFISSLSNYAMDKRNGISWEKNDVRILDGYRNYYRMVEGDAIDGIVKHLSEKFNIDLVRAMKEDISS